MGCDDDPVIIEEIDEKVTINIPDYDYVQRQFYYLETPGDDFMNPEFGFGMFYPVIGGPDGDDSLEVFVTLRTDIEWRSNTRPKYYVEAWTDPNNDGDLSDGDRFIQWFYLLYEGVDYDLIQDYGSGATTPKYIGIRLRQPLGSEKALAVRYRMDLGSQVVTVGDYGNFPATPVYPPADPDPSLTITAELICPPEEDFAPSSMLGASYTSTWNMMFRNVYSFDFSSIALEAMEIEIWSVAAVSGSPEVHDYSKEKYLRLFGLDRYRLTGIWGSDGHVDIMPGVVDIDNGYIIFPSPAPFNVLMHELRAWFSEGPPEYFISDSLRIVVDSIGAHLERNSGIYDEIYDRNNPPYYYDIVIELPKEGIDQ